MFYIGTYDKIKIIKFIKNNMSEKIQEDNINKNKTVYSLEDSIDRLNKKLKQLENNYSLLNPLKKEVLENQIRELKKLQEKYNKEKQKLVTNKTKKELNIIFKDINNSIINWKIIWKKIKKWFNILENEVKQKKDNLDIFWFNMSYRDFIEKNIDFPKINESFIDWEQWWIKDFYNYFTVEYINFLDNNIAIKATHKNLKRLNGLNISKNDLYTILNKTLERFIYNNKNINFKYITIKLNSKEIKIDLNKRKESLLKKLLIKETKEIKQIINSISKRMELKNILYVLKWNIPNSKNAILINLKIEKLKELWIIINKKDLIDFLEQKINKNKASKKIKENIKITSLLEKYLKIIDIKDRWDINNYSFLKKMMFDYYEWRITIKEFKDILIKGYYYAFKQELKSIRWKKWLENIKKYKTRWQNIFIKEVWPVLNNADNAKDLFLLSWVESNAKPYKKSSSEAQWRFQILLSTANKVDDNTYTIEDLHNPITSAQISAKYLKQIITKIKKENPNKNFSDKKLLEIAITRYNWNWSTRLKESFKEKNNNDSIKLIYLVFKELNFIKAMVKKWDLKKIKTKLQETHDKFFKKHKNIKSWETHFSILDDINKWKNVTKKEIKNWIEKYTNEILKQQLMYPYQLEAIKELYNE